MELNGQEVIAHFLLLRRVAQALRAAARRFFARALRLRVSAAFFAESDLLNEITFSLFWFFIKLSSNKWLELSKFSQPQTHH